MHVLVTGAAGFVGAAICADLSARGVPVLAIPTAGHGEQLCNGAVHARNLPQLVRSRAKLKMGDIRWLVDFEHTDAARQDGTLGTHEAWGAVWFLDNPSLAPSTVTLAMKLSACCSPSAIIATLKVDPRTRLAQISNGIDPIQLAVDCIELAQGGTP